MGRGGGYKSRETIVVRAAEEGECFRAGCVGDVEVICYCG